MVTQAEVTPVRHNPGKSLYGISNGVCACRGVESTALAGIDRSFDWPAVAAAD